MREIYIGSTGHSEFFSVVDNISGLPYNGLLGTQITIASYARTRSYSVGFSTSNGISPTGVWVAGAWIQQSSTLNPGLYRCDLPDAAFVQGADSVVFSFTATGVLIAPKEFRLITNDNQSVGGYKVTSTGVYDKTGYSLTQQFPSNFASMYISSIGGISGINEYPIYGFPTVGQIAATNIASGISTLTAAQVWTYATRALNMAVAISGNYDKLGYGIDWSQITNTSAFNNFANTQISGGGSGGTAPTVVQINDYLTNIHGSGSWQRVIPNDWVS